MPNVRKFRKSRKFQKRPRFTRKVVPTESFRRNVVMSIPKSMKPEIKKYTAVLAESDNISASGLVYPILSGATGIAKGDDVDERTGNKIFVKWITIRGYFYSSSARSNCLVRSAVVKDKEPNAAALAPVTIGDIWEYGLVGSTPDTDMLAFPLKSNQGRFSIKEDKTIAMPNFASGIAGDETVAHHVPFYHKIICNKTVNYSETSNNVLAGANWNYVVYSNVTSNEPVVNAMVRIYFTDA